MAAQARLEPVDIQTEPTTTAERNTRVWPASVSAIARWCRQIEIAPLFEKDVYGANENERRHLAALGGLAAALADGNPGADIRSLPSAVRRWLNAAPRPSSDLVDALRQELGSKEDPLALLYERIVSSPRRRWLGTFFTPSPVLAYMKGLVTGRPAPQNVADPGAGVGAFAAAARLWWPKATVHAVDINLVTLGLLATRPDVGGTGKQDPKGGLRVHHVDFLEWLATTWPSLKGPRLIIGNPPYTRHQLMSSTDKSSAQEATSELLPGGRAGLSTYFLAASLRALADADSLCLLLPANWLEADYAQSVRKHLWTQTTRHVDLHLFPNDLNVFPGAQVAAMVIVVGPKGTRRRPFRIVQVHGDVETGFSGTEAVKIDRRDGRAPASFSPSHVRQASEMTEASEGGVDGILLGHLAVVRRGVATGANSFFLRTKAEADALPAGACVAAISRLRTLDCDVLDSESHQQLSSEGARCWLLRVRKRDEQDRRIQQLLEKGVADGLDKRVLCSVRDPWYDVEQIPIPDLLFGPMGKRAFRVIRNEVGATPTNTLYGVRMRYRQGTRFPSGAVVLAEWLQSEEGQEALRVAARKHHGDGLVKIEPKALARVRIPSSVADRIAPGQ